MDTKITKLNNNIEFAYKRNPDTPRVAFYLNFSLNRPVTEPGVYSLMVRLFMQGTKNRTAQQLSEELDKYAIEFTAELKLDYIKFKFVCLNEDFEKAIEIFTDIVKNTTFEEFEKERIKLEGEIIAELDSPRAKIIDSYYKNIYEGHNYGYTNTVILDNLKNIKKQDVIDAYKNIVDNSKKVVAFVGDLDFDKVNKLLEENFGDITPSKPELAQLANPFLEKTKNIEITQPDLNQAHILKGWLVSSADSEDYASIALLNIILGASGLSSRLFLELRDKKGLAYVVRSAYDVARLSANFSIYIATEPSNIETSLKGFEEEIQKIKTIPVSEEELENAKNNIFGKWAFIGETNAQQANWLAHYGIMGFGFDFHEKAVENIKKVTPQDILDCANKYFNDTYVLTVLKP
jgi:processing protease